MRSADVRFGGQRDIGREFHSREFDDSLISACGSGWRDGYSCFTVTPVSMSDAKPEPSSN
jgi:hypothetical protein